MSMKGKSVLVIHVVVDIIMILTILKLYQTVLVFTQFEFIYHHIISEYCVLSCTVNTQNRV